MIDMRSDTVSQPSLDMRRAMAEAEVGDDCYGDDPTVKRLEAETAALLGKEDAVYLPTGTMSNQVAIRAHTEPGDAVIMEHQAHIYLLEGGAPFALSGVHPRLMPGVRGVFTAAEVQAAIPGTHPYFPVTWMAPAGLVCLENTHNLGGGKIWPLEAILAVAAAARAAGLKLHLDGARHWHATAATGIPEAVYAEPFDTVSVCFSKGLGAPVGSALAGSRAFITRARRFKAQFGGGFRQAGIIAAGALFGLRNHRQRLGEDHIHARLLADRIAPLPGVELDPATVETNILRFSVTAIKAGDLAFRLHDRGLHVLPSGDDGIRMIPHLNHTRKDVEAAAAIVERVMQEIPSSR